MNWLIPAILSATGFSASNVLTKIYLSKFGLNVGFSIYAIGVLVSAAILMVVTKSTGAVVKGIGSSAWVAMLAGILWFSAQYLYVYAISKNIAISIVIPFVVGGIGIGGVLGGVLFFGEQLTIMRILGVVIVLLGSVILAKS